MVDQADGTNMRILRYDTNISNGEPKTRAQQTTVTPASHLDGKEDAPHEYFGRYV